MSELRISTSSTFPTGRMVGIRSQAMPGREEVGPGELAEAADESHNRYRIRTAHCSSFQSDAASLVERRYAWRGYSTGAAPLQAVGRRTFSACVGDETVATITAGVDSDDGLYVAALYPDAVQSLRDNGHRLCEFTRLAVDDSMRSQAVLASIFHVAHMHVYNLHQCTDVLIEVNPRHVRFYERMLGFVPAASERIDPVVNAPAVLLRADLRHCADEIARLGGRRHDERGRRSLYPFFFGPEQAARIVSRLRGH